MRCGVQGVTESMKEFCRQNFECTNNEGGRISLGPYLQSRKARVYKEGMGPDELLLYFCKSLR